MHVVDDAKREFCHLSAATDHADRRAVAISAGAPTTGQILGRRSVRGRATARRARRRVRATVSIDGRRDGGQFGPLFSSPFAPFGEMMGREN